ncbi:MAG: hypothetical protein JKY30_04360 [Flavobacteriales bacterium]|nr:hypothetical protein [Flavobacteriales bacterium]
MKKITGIVVIVLGLVSCGAPKMDAKLIKSMTLGYEKGVVAGIDIGDNWGDVKKNAHKEWEIDSPEERVGSAMTIGSLSRSWDMFNNVFISVGLDNNNNVWELSYTINGKKGNHLLIAEIENALKEEFNYKYEVSEYGGWNFVSPNGGKCGLNLNLNKQEDVGSNSLSINVFNLSQ